MDTIISIPVKVLYYTDEQYTNWKNGDRNDCPDPYCRKLPGTYGFGENLVGNYFHTLGYEWIHHDYNVFAESKRVDTKDRLRDQQVRGLALLSLLFGCRVDVFEVVRKGAEHEAKKIVWTL